ncbi:MAG TPA: ankyrin repeat domain-containing protein [Steroidobacteraceae bacterium]|nr:ankyrin repeat domain-containing protein [Steroidobacteraceae bacterium]
MITRPPGQDPSDEADELYRRASALDPSRPRESVRRAVLAHAAQLSAASGARGKGSRQPTPAAARARWRGAIFGGLAAAALAALVIAPRIFTPGMPKVSAPRPASLDGGGKLSGGAPASLAMGAPPASTRAPPAAFSAQEAPSAGARTDSAREEARVAAAISAAKPAGSSLSGAPAAHLAQQRQAYAAAAPPAPLAGSDTTQPEEAFRQAAAAGDLSALAALRPKQSDINARDGSGRTALMLATVNGQAAAVLALLDYGADPNVADGRGVTPLEAARGAARGADQAAIVAGLLRHGAR